MLEGELWDNDLHLIAQTGYVPAPAVPAMTR